MHWVMVWLDHWVRVVSICERCLCIDGFRLLVLLSNLLGLVVRGQVNGWERLAERKAVFFDLIKALGLLQIFVKKFWRICALLCKQIMRRDYFGFELSAFRRLLAFFFSRVCPRLCVLETDIYALWEHHGRLRILRVLQSGISSIMATLSYCLLWRVLFTHCESLFRVFSKRPIPFLRLSRRFVGSLSRGVFRSEALSQIAHILRKLNYKY